MKKSKSWKQISKKLKANKRRFLKKFKIRKKSKLKKFLEKIKLPKIPWKTGLFTLLLGSDLLAKQYVDTHMEPGEQKEFFDGNLKIRKVYNKGFILDTMDDRPDIVRNASLGITGLLALYNTWLMNSKGHLIKKFGMVLLSAGAISNTFDRVTKGKVVDYIGIKSENEKLSKITGNLADVYVFVGSLIASIGR